MLAELKFDLDQPDDAMAHLRCIKARDMALAINCIINNSSLNEKQLEEVLAVLSIYSIDMQDLIV